MGALNPSAIDGFLDQLLSPEHRNVLSESGRVDGKHSSRLGHFQFRVLNTQAGFAIAFRIVEEGEAPLEPEEIKTLNEEWPTDSIEALLQATFERRASDLLLSNGTSARVRSEGCFRPIEGASFGDEEILKLLSKRLTPERGRQLDQAGSIDLAFTLPEEMGGHRFRLNVFRQQGGLAAAFRPIWDEIPELETLNLPQSLKNFIKFPYGLVLVVGPTGSGKSTTLATLIETLNQEEQRHIITLEDPIEYLFKEKRCLIHQREVGFHVESFSSGLRAALREAPDIIFVGEMRDRATISAALTAAETGHLVLATLHSGSSAQAIDRILDIYPEHQQKQIRIQLSDVLRGIVVQRLIPGIYESRLPACEVVPVSYALSALIREQRTHQFATVIQTGRKEGMIPMECSLADWVRQGQIEELEARRHAKDKRFFEVLLADTQEQEPPAL